MTTVGRRRAYAKKIAKAMKYTFFTIIGIIAIALLFPTWTPGIEGKNSISRLEQIDINGTGHEVMIRGVDRSNPVLLFVHGDRGVPRFRMSENTSVNWSSISPLFIMINAGAASLIILQRTTQT